MSITSIQYILLVCQLVLIFFLYGLFIYAHQTIQIVIKISYSLRIEDKTAQMDNVDIIKKRLRDLKELSQSLKNQTVLDSNGQDIVKLVMDLTRDINPRHDRNPSALSIDQIITQKKVKRQSINKLSESHSQNSSIPIYQQSVSKENNLSEYIQNLEQSDNSEGQAIVQPQNDRNYRQETGKSNQKLEVEKRLFKKWEGNEKSLEDENFDGNDYFDRQKLEIDKISKKGEKLRKLSQEFELKQMFKNSDNSHYLTYHRIEENVEAFLTKIQVFKSDFTKIDYVSAIVSLQLDYILFRSLAEQNSSYRTKRLSLSDISGVEYFDPHVLVLVFEQKQRVSRKSLFIKYNSYQQRRKWDIGIYMNMTLIKMLKKQKMFEGQNIEGVLSNMQNSNSQKSQISIINKSNNISNNSNSKNNQIDKRQNEKVSQVEVRSNKSSSLNKQRHSEKGETLLNVQKKKRQRDDQLYIQLEKQKQKKRQHQHQRKEKKDVAQSGVEFSNGWQKFIQQSINKKWEEQKKKRMQSQSSLLFNNNEKTIIKREPSGQTQYPQYNQIQMEKESAHENGKNQQRKRQEQQNKQFKRKNEQEEKHLATAKNILKSGFFMIKYSQGAVNPHQKKVYLSEDERRLYWQDRQKAQIFKSQPKYVLLLNITSVDLGAFGPGIQKHIKKKDIDIKNSFLTIKLKNQSRKQLQFGIPNEIKLLQQFVSSLSLVLKNLKVK